MKKLNQQGRISQALPASLRIEGSVFQSLENLSEAEKVMEDRYARLSLTAVRVLLERIARGSVVSPWQWARFALFAAGEL